MSEEENTILNDKREISSINFNEGAGELYSSAHYDIEAYGEPGMHCMLPWFRVKRKHDGFVVARVPAHQVSVHYKQPA